MRKETSYFSKRNVFQGFLWNSKPIALLYHDLVVYSHQNENGVREAIEDLENQVSALVSKAVEGDTQILSLLSSLHKNTLSVTLKDPRQLYRKVCHISGS